MNEEIARARRLHPSDGQREIDRQLARDWAIEVERMTAKLATEVADSAEAIANEG